PAEGAHPSALTSTNVLRRCRDRGSYPKVASNRAAPNERQEQYTFSLCESLGPKSESSSKASVAAVCGYATGGQAHGNRYFREQKSQVTARLPSGSRRSASSSGP